MEKQEFLEKDKNDMTKLKDSCRYFLTFLKLFIHLSLVIATAILFYRFIEKKFNQKNTQLDGLHMNKYRIDERVKKLVIEMTTVINKLDQVEKDYAKITTSNERKKKDIENHKSEIIQMRENEKIKKPKRDKYTKQYEELLKTNNEIKEKVNEIEKKFEQDRKTSDKEQKLKSNIRSYLLDSDLEIIEIKKWINKNNVENIDFNLCYRGIQGFFNPKLAYDSCNFLDEKNEFLFIYQTNSFYRFGIYKRSNISIDSPFIFDLEEKKQYNISRTAIVLDKNKMIFPYVEITNEPKFKKSYELNITTLITEYSINKGNLDRYVVYGTSNLPFVGNNTSIQNFNISWVEVFTLKLNSH